MPLDPVQEPQRILEALEARRGLASDLQRASHELQGHAVEDAHRIATGERLVPSPETPSPASHFAACARVRSAPGAAAVAIVR
jgi:hypothetical protein